jgi:hypothetical protein
MLHRAFELRQVCGHYCSTRVSITCPRQAIKLFLSTADEKFGPITTLRRQGAVVKHIPWTAFMFTESDWTRVVNARAILEVSGSTFKCVHGYDSA